jgi:hypothetical protein
MKNFVITTFIALTLFSCKKKDDPAPEPEPEPVATPANTLCPTCEFPDTVWNATGSGPRLIFKFKFDSMQTRLNNVGLAATIPTANAGQSPRFNGMSAHYIEMARYDTTQVGKGAVLYKAEETSCGGAKAITFCKSVVCKENDVCFSIPIGSVTPGTYKWLRVSLAYQNYDIKVRANGQNLDGTIASFVGFNTYFTKYKMKGAVMTPTTGGTGNHAQGYWGFYTKVQGIDYKSDGQSQGTTVVNPNFANSPIPAGSCLVTGEFYKLSSTSTSPLVITGSETSDIIITISLSTNKSFEWKEQTFDGLFEPSIGETVVDMGLRGLIPKY